MTNEHVKLRDAAIMAMLEDLRVNGMPQSTLLAMTGNMLRIRGARTMSIQMEYVDIWISEESFDAVLRWIEAARLVGQDKPLFPTRTGDRTLSYGGLRKVIQMSRRRSVA